MKESEEITSRRRRALLEGISRFLIGKIHTKTLLKHVAPCLIVSAENLNGGSAVNLAILEDVVKKWPGFLYDYPALQWGMLINPFRVTMMSGPQFSRNRKVGFCSSSPTINWSIKSIDIDASDVRSRYSPASDTRMPRIR